MIALEELHLNSLKEVKLWKRCHTDSNFTVEGRKDTTYMKRADEGVLGLSFLFFPHSCLLRMMAKAGNLVFEVSSKDFE